MALNQLSESWPIVAEFFTRAMVMTEEIRLETLKREAAELQDRDHWDRLTLVGQPLTVASWVGKK